MKKMVTDYKKIAGLCLKKYKESPRQGKPQTGQWTVLVGIVMEFEDKLEVISLATGTKCLSGPERIGAKIPGVVLNDCHAEVLARRGLIYWIQGEILSNLNQDASKYLNFITEGKVKLKPEIKFHMYSSFPPCGDATIFPITKDQNHLQDEQSIPVENNTNGTENNEPPLKKFKQSNDNVEDTPNKIDKTENKESDIEKTLLSESRYANDLNRTGAKCVEGSVKDPAGEGLEYHVVGQVRTKPGRGDRTLSLSCSDKILKWNNVGIQGSLLSNVLEENIYLTSITIGSTCFNMEACHRAFNKRCSTQKHTIQVFNYNEEEFVDCKSDDKVPCPDSSLLVTGAQSIRETYVGGTGLRQGWAKKRMDNPKSWSSICQRKLASRNL